MKKLSIFAIAIIASSFVFTSCEKKDKHEQAFYDYVQTDFDNPDDFIEITKIEHKDTLTNKESLELIQTIEEFDFLVYDEYRKEELEEIKERIEMEEGVATFEVKARIKTNNDKMRVVTYYGMENLNNGDIRIQRTEFKESDAPQCFLDLIDFVKKIVE